MHPNGPERQAFDLTTLRQISEKLREPSCSFVLYVANGFSERVLQFADGCVRSYSFGERTFPGLTSFLLSRKIVDPRTLEKLITTANSSSRPLETVLVERGILSPDGLKSAIKKITRDSVFDLVFWREASCTVFDPQPPQNILERIVTMPAAKIEFALLSEDLRRWSELWPHLRSTLGSESTPIVITDLGAATLESYDGHLREHLELCRDPADVRELCSRSDADLLHVCEHLEEMEKLGWIHVGVETPGSRSAKQELADGIAILERNLDAAIDVPLVREKLVHLCGEARLPDKAVLHLHELTTTDLTRGDWKVAVDRLKRILDLDPANVEAFRGIVTIYHEHHLEREAVRLITSHARMLVSRHRLEEARSVAQTIGHLSSGRIEADMIEAEILGQEDDVPAAVKILLRLTDTFEQRGDRSCVADTLKKALILDPTNERLRNRVLGVQSSSVATPAVSETKTPASDATVLPDTGDSEPPPSRAVEIDLPRPLRSAVLVFVSGLLVLAALGYVYWTTVGPVAAKGPLGSQDAFAASPAAAQGPLHDLSARPPSRYPARGPAGGRSPSAEEPATDVGLSAMLRPKRPDDGKTRRVINDNELATFATSQSFVLTHRSTGQKLYELPGRGEEHWSVGYRGRIVCRWRAGNRPMIFRPPNTRPVVLGWTVPVDTAAVAVGNDELALRRGTHTIFYRLDGRPTGGGEAPLWTEGVYLGNTLVLQRPALTAEDGPEVWCLRHSDLEVLWTCANEDGAAVFR